MVPLLYGNQLQRVMREIHQRPEAAERCHAEVPRRAPLAPRLVSKGAGFLHTDKQGAGD